MCLYDHDCIWKQHIVDEQTTFQVEIVVNSFERHKPTWIHSTLKLIRTDAIFIDLFISYLIQFNMTWSLITVLIF